MSDDDSFVILEAPQSSIGSNGIISLENDLPGGSLSSLNRSHLNEALKSHKNSLENVKEFAPTFENENLIPIKSIDSASVNLIKSTTSSSNSSGASQLSFRSGKSVPEKDSSLAASFIMGEINAEVLKTSIYSQFPSLCSMEACADDAVKLQTLMAEYVGLKNTLIKINDTTKQYFDKINQFKEDMQRTEQQYKKDLSDCQTQIATLRNENLELKNEINNKIEQLRISDEMRKQDHEAMIKNISEKTSQISNMRATIEKLESQQLASFEYISKNANDTKDKPDYVDRLEHERITKQLGRQMSELLAENLDLKDVQKQYIDEITALQVNLVSAEELIKQSRADIQLLKAQDLQKSDQFTRYEKERDEMKEEIFILRQQVDVYCKDFTIERTAREGLAGEKDQLLQDLRALQRKNQELIESAQKRVEEYERRTSIPAVPQNECIIAASAAAKNLNNPIKLPSPSPQNIYRCPICFVSFSSLTYLQGHVDSCLDNAK